MTSILNRIRFGRNLPMHRRLIVDGLSILACAVFGLIWYFKGFDAMVTIAMLAFVTIVAVWYFVEDFFGVPFEQPIDERDLIMLMLLCIPVMALLMVLAGPRDPITFFASIFITAGLYVTYRGVKAWYWIGRKPS